MKRNAGGIIAFFARNSDGTPKTGDAANITGSISKDGGAFAALSGLPTELATCGIYFWTLSTTQTDADLIVGKAASATSGVTLEPVLIYTTPALCDVGYVNGAAITPVAGNVPAELKTITAGVDFSAVMKASITAAVPTAAQNRQEMDANSTKLAEIVADTSETQGELADGGRIDLLIDGIKTAAESAATDADANVAKLDALGVKVTKLVDGIGE